MTEATTVLHDPSYGTVMLHALVESLPDGVALFNKEKKIITINTAFTTMTGLPKEGFYLSELNRLFQPHFKVETELDKVLTTTTTTTTTVREAPFSRFFYDVYLTAVRDENRNLLGGVFVLHDMTHLKAIDRMKTEFISLAAHQLRTPLTSINWYIEMLAAGNAGELNEKQKNFSDEIYNGSKRMVKLVNDLLNLSRLETGRLAIEPVPTDLVALIKNINAEVGQLAKARHCAIVIQGPRPPLPKISVDPELLRQVFSNVIVNAIRYSPKEKECTVTVGFEIEQGAPPRGGGENVENMVVVSVRDEGIGIPKDAQARVFEKFFRADNARSAEAEGSGLGLYIVKLILEASGGNIWFESREGKGTTFNVAIPMGGMKEKAGEKGLAT